MKASIVIGSLLTLALLAGYYVMRSAATQCVGSACDGYIIPSLLLPLLILIIAAITGVLAVSVARRRSAVWGGALALCTALSALGPIASVIIWRDHPDTVVLSSTLLIVLLPVCALLFSLLGNQPESSSGRA